MRTLCLLLILANALFFIWSQLIDVRVSPLDRVTAPGATPPPRIVLAHEVTDGVRKEAPAGETMREVAPPSVEPLTLRTQPAATAGADSLSCASVGPFADLPQAAQAQSALRVAGYQPRQRLEQGELWVGYWVSVQNLATRDVAEATVKTLNDNGITDVYLMPESEPANVLSLGVFSDYERAQRRADQLRALGLEPSINDRKRAGSVYWLDVDLPEPGQILDTSVFQTGEARIMRLELRACPESAAGRQSHGP